MDLEKNNMNIFELVTDLSKQLLQVHQLKCEDSCALQTYNKKIIKKLRAEAFGILLNKTKQSCTRSEKSVNTEDPVVAILKYTFALKLGENRTSAARSLEYLLDELLTDGLEKESTIYTVLQFLVSLKTFKIDAQDDLDIFSYNKINPTLPKSAETTNSLFPLHIYPIETFILSDKFEALLGMRKYGVKQDPNINISNYFFKPIQSMSIDDSKTFDSTTNNISSNALLSIPNLYLEYSNINSTTCFQVISNTLITKEDSNTNTFAKYPWIKQINIEGEDISKLQVSTKLGKKYSDFMWDEIDYHIAPVSQACTWESLGKSEASPQALFVTDTLNAMLHIGKIRQASTFFLLPQKTIKALPIDVVISRQEFLSDVKSLLIGLESVSFRYNIETGFYLQKHITVCGIGKELLTSMCSEFINWGNSYKFLCNLAEPDPCTGKLQHEGLIFNAMCISLKELLLFHQAVLLRMFSQFQEQDGLLKVLVLLRPIAQTIVEVAKLFGSTGNHSALVEGSAILSLIYNEVTRVTNPRLSLILYSLLKSCCEVYFRFLQMWLFEGICDDIYGEFMIKVQPQYLGDRAHKFWTKSFAIFQQAVPGFLTELAESILQCGKAVRLLKVCDPKNPVCTVFTTSKPELKVCLSIDMLHEQLLKCKDYEQKGEIALGEIISLASAIEDEKNVEKRKLDIAVRTQEDTLSRIERDRKEHMKSDIQKKQELLKILKEQAEEAVLQQQKAKEMEMIADKLLLEKISREQEEEIQSTNRTNLIKCYEDLSTNIQNRQTRSNWRIRRMKYFEKRATALVDGSLDIQMSCNKSSDIMIESERNIEKTEENSKIEEKSTNRTIINISDLKHEDENCNPEDDRIVCTAESESTKLANVENMSTYLPRSRQINRKNNERSSLQDFLSETSIKQKIFNQRLANLSNELTQGNVQPITVSEDSVTIGEQIITRPKFLHFEKLDNMSEAVRNKFNVLQQEYAITPNNNEVKLVFTNEKENQNIELLAANGTVPAINVNTNIAPKEFQVPENNTETSVNSIRDEKLTKEKSSTLVRNATKEITNYNHMWQGPLTNSTDSGINSETPISCKTDNYTLSLSVDTPGSQLLTNAEDIAVDVQYTPSYTADTFMFDAIRSKYSKADGRSMYKCSEKLQTDSNLNVPSESSLTAEDIENIDNISLQVYLEKSIAIPLQVQSRLVNNALIKYFIKEHNILLHLHSLRSYFFLLNGEFAKTLTDLLYTRLYEISVPLELFNSATLTNLLERALVHSFNSNYINSDLLTLSAVDTPHQLHISDPHALDCLCLNYKISWPLNIIFDEMVMLQYSKVFKFLIMTGRVSWVLQEDFHIMKIERKAATSEQYHKLQQYRHSMTQFMNALHNYLTCSVLYASWTEFEKDLQNSRTLDQIYLSHVSYIKRILSRCMLNVHGAKMRSCLNDVFRVILKFHNRLRSQEWVKTDKSYIHPNFRSLEQMYHTFCELRAYLTHVAFKYATTGYQPHLMHFLDALNINPLYDLTAKG